MVEVFNATNFNDHASRFRIVSWLERFEKLTGETIVAVDGDGGDHKAIGLSPFRSLLERDLRNLLSANPEVRSYAIEPHTLEYYIPTEAGGYGKHIYVPDVVICCRPGTIAVLDAKAFFFTTTTSWLRREPHITAAYNIDHPAGIAVATVRIERRQAVNQSIPKRKDGPGSWPVPPRR